MKESADIDILCIYKMSHDTFMLDLICACESLANGQRSCLEISAVDVSLIFSYLGIYKLRYKNSLPIRWTSIIYLHSAVLRKFPARNNFWKSNVCWGRVALSWSVSRHTLAISKTSLKSKKIIQLLWFHVWLEQSFIYCKADAHLSVMTNFFLWIFYVGDFLDTMKELFVRCHFYKHVKILQILIASYNRYII